jgi:hypothetical protein
VAAARDLIFRWWQRSTEMTADRAGIIACGRPSKAISAQLKVGVGPRLHQHVNLAELAQQAADLQTGVGRVEGFFSALGTSHPFLVSRIEAMLDFVSECDLGREEEPRAAELAVAARLATRHPSERREYVLDQRPVVVGRSPSTDFKLYDRSVSRRHFEVQWLGGEYILRDVGSSNGTFVNGQRVRLVHLQHGDVIRAGLTELEFTLD